MADVFLSYASEDRQRVAPLVELLEQAGLTVWWDRRIGLGASFDLEIERELEASSCVVVVWSEHSVRSDWVRNEATDGQERGILVPVLIDDVRLPLATRRVQTAELAGWPETRDETALEQLLASVRSLVKTASQHDDEAAGSQSRGPVVIAILPFADRSPEGSLKHLCDGIAEDLMDALFRVEDLRVLSTTDTFRAHQGSLRISDIGHQLGATVVLEGSARPAGDRVAISARLVLVETGISIWSQRFTPDAASAFEVCHELARSAALGLNEHLHVRGSVQTTPVRPRDSVAYGLYDRARQLAGDSEIARLKRLALLELAVAQDPDLVDAYVPLIHLYATLGVVSERHERQAKTDELMSRLERLDPNGHALADAREEIEPDMVALADMSGAGIESGHRVHAYPHPRGWRDARSHLALALTHAGLPREALAFYQLVDRENEPNRSWNWLHQAGCHQMLGEFDAAIERYQLHRRTYGDSIGNEFEALCHIGQGQLDRADGLAQGSEFQRRFLVHPLIRHRQGENVVERTYELAEQRGGREPVGLLCLAIGETERGFEYLKPDRAHDHAHWRANRLLLTRHLFDDRAVNQPDFAHLLAQLGLDPATRQAVGARVDALAPITGISFQQPLMPI